MGHGASRELEGPSGPLPELDPEVSKRLEGAMQKMDALDSQFKSNRDDERLAQTSKLWNLASKEIDAHLRTIAKVLVQSHQVSLEPGSDGGGISIKPWLEDTAGKFQRLTFRLTESQELIASIGSKDFATGTLDSISHEWLVNIVAEWLILAVEQKT